MSTREARALSRDVEVAAIPYGDKITLTAGTTVYITQSLGGSHTALTDEEVAGRSIEELAWDQLKTVFDPEIPVNIVDLGLVYKCEVESLEDGKKKVKVEFTLTAPGCGMGDFLREDVRGKLLAIPSVGSADVEVVLEPPWDHSMMSDGARLQLGLM
jgi:probable FeS assembly SUF system protein SufT